MVRHIQFCLEEIEAEIEAVDMSRLGARAREGLAHHIAGIRSIVETAAAVAAQRVEGDDLGLIRGIGAAEATLLRAAGVTRYATIAAWQTSDMAALGAGRLLMQRIQREGWIEQAAILAAGGLTDYARELLARRGPSSGLGGHEFRAPAAMAEAIAQAFSDGRGQGISDCDVREMPTAA